MKSEVNAMRTAGVMLSTLAVCLFVGCSVFGRIAGPRWHSDFDSAELAVRKSRKPLLVRYVDSKPGRADPLDEALDQKEVRRRLQEFECCRLFRAYEPDRRYVGQFGIERAPAVILVRADDTFHAATGRLDGEELLALLDKVGTVGRSAIRNPYIRRDARYDWTDGFSNVVQAVEDSGTPGLVLLYRRFSPDFDALSEMLETHEVYSRIGSLVHGRESAWNRWARTRKTPIGEVKLPALVLMRPGGAYDVLEMPGSSAAIAHFADRFFASGEERATQAATISEPSESSEPTE